MELKINRVLRQDTPTGQIEQWYEVVDEDGDIMAVFEYRRQALFYIKDYVVAEMLADIYEERNPEGYS